MRRQKNFFLPILIFLLVLGVTLFTPNLPTEKHNGYTHAEVETTEIAPCARYGKHLMIAQGPAVVKNYKTKKVIFQGGWYQCDCGQKFLAQGYPENKGPIGKYATSGAIKSGFSHAGASGFNVDPKLVYTTSKTTIPGYKFRF